MHSCLNSNLFSVTNQLASMGSVCGYLSGDIAPLAVLHDLEQVEVVQVRIKQEVIDGLQAAL